MNLSRLGGSDLMNLMFALPITFVYFLFVNVLVTVMMTGIVYFVHFVHYPLFYAVPAEHMPEYSERNSLLTSFVVVPLMLVETVTTVWLANDPVFPNLNLYFNLGMVLVAILWASTLFLQMPCHRKLSQRYDAKVIAFLIRSNWIRIIAWSVRSILMLFLIFQISHQCLPK